MPDLNDKTSIYPSDFISPEKKNEAEYCLKWSEYMDTVGYNSENNGFFPGFLPGTQYNKFAIWRSYARGQQSIDKYKPILGVKGKVRNDPAAISYRVLNWEILDIASKYVNILIGKLIKQNNDIGVYAVDKAAQDERRKVQIEQQDQVINGAFYQGITDATGIQFEKPQHDDVIPPPQTLGEVDMFMEMFYKEKYCLVVQDMLKDIGEGDNYNELLFEVARNLVEVKTAATKTYRIGNKILRRNCDPERMGISASNKSNFENIKWIYEDWDLTIGQLKEIAGDQFTEQQYKEIAEKTGKSFADINISEYYRDNMCYPWDNTKVTVKDCVWFSPDWKTETVDTNNFGNIEIQRRSFDWWNKLSEKGVTEKKFNEVNKSQVYRYRIDNQYQCMWIKGTKFVFNYGLSKDMLKNQSTLGRTVGPYTVYQLKKCIIETIMTTLDNIQIQWLQFQHHAAKSVPAGPAIEFSALQDISISGAGGKAITPKQALQIYFDTGVLLWRRRDAAGNMTNFKPIEELAGGISNAMEKHFSFMIQDINLLRGQIGLNELTDASTPNSEMGKAVATMASGGTDDALRPLHFAFDEINKGTQMRTVMHISGMAATGLAPEYTEALGTHKMSLVALLSDLTMHELGVYVQKAPTDEVNLWFRTTCEKGVDKGSLLEEEAFEIINEPNVYKRIRLLKMYRQQKQQAAQENFAREAQVKSQNDIASAQSSQQYAQQTEQMKIEGQKELAWEQAKAEAWKNKQSVTDQAFLLDVQNQKELGKALSEEDAHRLTELSKINAKGQWDLTIAKAKPKPTSSAK